MKKRIESSARTLKTDGRVNLILSITAYIYFSAFTKRNTLVTLKTRKILASYGPTLSILSPKPPNCYIKISATEAATTPKSNLFHPTAKYSYIPSPIILIAASPINMPVKHKFIVSSVFT